MMCVDVLHAQYLSHLTAWRHSKVSNTDDRVHTARLPILHPTYNRGFKGITRN